jgi:hypothetical protein
MHYIGMKKNLLLSKHVEILPSAYKTRSEEAQPGRFLSESKEYEVMRYTFHMLLCI